ncbi:MAG: DUF5050 domain-containing protein [Candidatus Scatovivens sp.]
MKCSKCGKEIPEGEKTICDECQKKLLEELKEENKKEELDDKVENVEKEFKAKEKTRKKHSPVIFILLIVIIILIIAGYYMYNAGLLNFNSKIGNSIGNIRNYGYMAESGGKIYFVAPDEKGEKMCIYRCDKNGDNKKILLSEDWDILGLNIIKNNIYFIAIDDSVEPEDENDTVNNKIYKMKIDGSGLEIINDNQFNNDSYEIYAIKDKIYYIGTDSNIYYMDLDGQNKSVVNSDATGFLGITEKYIICNVQEKDEEGNSKTVTYSMNLDGSNRKAITGERLYSINIVKDDVYYVNEEKNVYKVNLETGEKSEVSKTAAYNMNISNNVIYFMNYCDEQYNIAIYKMDLDGSNEEKLLQLDSYSTFLDVVGNKVMYMDSNDEKGVINLLDGKTKETANLYEYIFETE